MLLRHTSGLVYEFTSPTIQKYLEHKGEQSGFHELYASHLKDPLVSLCKSTAPRCRQLLCGNDNGVAQRVRPLLFEPGNEWAYSPGLDWAGFMVCHCLSTRIRFPKPKD
jgi:hypothetical protein